MKKNKFTLIEIIIAVAIFSIVMFTVMISTNAVLQTRSKVSEHKNNLLSYQKLDNLFNSSIRNAIPFHWKNEDNKKVSIFLGESDKINLAYQHRIISASEGGIRFLSLYLEGNNLIAKYRKTPILPWNNEHASNLKTEVIAKNVELISFLYAAKNDKEIHLLDSWEFENSFNIPVGISITIKWEDGKEQSWFKRTAGAGLNESFGKRKNDEID